MTYYCLGMRLNDAYQELSCSHRDSCPYYGNVSLGEARAHPERYQELETYNNKKCEKYEKGKELFIPGF